MSTSSSGSISGRASDSSLLVSVTTSSSTSDDSSDRGNMNGGDAGRSQRAKAGTAIAAAKQFGDRAKAPGSQRPRTQQEDLLAGYFAGAPMEMLEEFVTAVDATGDHTAREVAEQMVDLIVQACQLPGAAAQTAETGAAPSSLAPGKLQAAATFGTFSGVRPGGAPGGLAAAGGFTSFVHTLPQVPDAGPVQVPQFTENEKFLLKLMQDDIDREKAKLPPPTMWAQTRAQVVASWIAAYGGFAFITFAAKLAALIGWREAYHLVNFGGAIIGNWGELRAARYRAMNPGYPGLDMGAYQGRDTLRDREAERLCELEGARGNNPARARKIEKELARLQLDVQKICVDCLRREHGHLLKWKKPADNHDVPRPFKSQLTINRGADGTYTVFRMRKDRTDQLFVIEAGSKASSVMVRWNDGNVTDLCKDAVAPEHRAAMDAFEDALIPGARWRSGLEDEIPLTSLNLHYEATGSMSPVIQSKLPGPLGLFVDLVFSTYVTVQATAGVFLWQNVMRWAIGGANASPGTSAELQGAIHEKAQSELRMHRMRMTVIQSVAGAIDRAIRVLQGRVDSASDDKREALQLSLDDHQLLQSRLRDLKRLCVKKEKQLVLAEKLARRQHEVIRAGWAASLKDHWVKQPLTGISRLLGYWFAFGFYAEVFVPRILLPLRPQAALPAPGNATAHNSSLAPSPAAVPGAHTLEPSGVEVNGTGAIHATATGFDYAAWGPYMAVGAQYGFVIGGLFSFRNNLFVPAIRRLLSNVVGTFRAENHRREANPDLDQQRFYKLVGALSKLKCCGGTQEEYVGAEDANPQQDAFGDVTASDDTTRSDTREDEASTVSHGQTTTATTATLVPHLARNLDGDDDEPVRLPRHGHDNDDSGDGEDASLV